VRELIEVAAGVYVATSRLMATTSTVLAAGGEALLVDPAWQADELASLAGELSARELRVVAGFATHAHHDHLLWHPGFGTAPRWSSEATARLAREERAALVEHLGSDVPAPLVDLMGRVDAVSGALPAGSVPTGFDPQLVVHDGHAPGHTALWLPDQRVLIAGDMLSDVELPLPFYPDDLPAYQDALEVLAPFAASAEVVVTGHGSPGSDALDRLDADRRYIDDVVSGRRPEDPRLANPGMADEYEHLRRMVLHQ
jgi:glyoxylase-like metal-dependent hydrolase (beta-lactamase superfamily II)